MSATLTAPARRRAVLAALGLPVLGLAACAARPPKAPPAEGAMQSWSGRLGLVIASDPPQQFHAGFDLAGTEQQGELRLSTPLGSILALLQWRPGEALLVQDGRTQAYPSIDALSTAATGTAVPLRALFAWLRGVPETVAGWQVDLSGLSGGRLLAQRLSPLPHAELRIVLDQP
ncbi:MAG: lipoprotein insertase outer membrane protein LolB [Burkholderiaceae bacterium]